MGAPFNWFFVIVKCIGNGSFCINYNKMVTRASNYPWSSYKSYTENEDKLISSEDKQMIMDLFSGSIVQFKKFI